MDSESRHQIPLKPIGVFKQTHPPVFLTSAVIIFGGILGAALFTDEAGQFFKSIQSGITTYFSWLFTLTTSSLLLLCLFLLFSRFGGIRLGKPDDRPEFDRITWFAMLFSAGMGIGLVFWSIAEPINHFMSPPSATHDVAGKTQLAMRTTYFHWGFHAWAIYCTMGLALALFSFRHGLPLTIRSLFYPLLKKKFLVP